jgi:mRNA interferase MazF
MTTYDPGDVLLVPFPFTDQTATKQRPAIVLSSRAFNLAHPDVILAPITSQIGGSTDEVVLRDWQSAGLLKRSAVKPLLSSFDTTLIRRRLGVLSSNDIAAVRALFKRILDLG